MTRFSKQTLFWAPRALSIAYSVFLAFFALDLFPEKRALWPTLLALVIHLVPALIVACILLLAWRREWLGALLYGAAGLWYSATVLRLQRSPSTKLSWILTIAGPAFVLALLFLINWIERGELRVRGT